MRDLGANRRVFAGAEGSALAELSDLSEARGISGQEGEVRQILARSLRGRVQELWGDSIGNLLARTGARGGKRVMLAAHMDEVGLLISRVEKSGFLRFAKVGGIDDRVLGSKPVLIGKDKVYGVIGTKPVHLQEVAERKRAFRADDLLIDIGAKSKEEAEKLVRPGDMATFHARFESFSGEVVKGKALDDRAGCAVLLEIMKADWRGIEVVGAFTSQEEIGVRGARVAAFALEPAAAIVVEATLCSDTPGTDPHEECTRLGDGPVITLMDRGLIADRAMVEELVETAEKEGIPYQFRRTTAGGNDAASIHLSREGVRTAVVSVPCRYIHSPASLMSLTDAENCLRLLTAYLRRVEAKECLAT